MSRCSGGMLVGTTSHSQLPDSETPHSTSPIISTTTAAVLFQFPSEHSPSLSLDSSGSSTIRGTADGRKDFNRWSGGSLSSLSRSNSDSSTLLKVRKAQHVHSASVPHIVTIRSGASRKKVPSALNTPPATYSANAIIAGASISKLSQHPFGSPYPSVSTPSSKSPSHPPSQPPPPPPPEKSALNRIAQHQQPTAPRKVRQNRSSSYKTMLGSALQMANTAVQLDSANNIEGAMEAYGDTCKLLQQAMQRASQEDDRRQLLSIVCPLIICYPFKTEGELCH